ncbi:MULTISPECIES: GNAT family N-acetyltransferase [unclassified Phycicoccus]|uniref:GNAT family N-acetyltransferase n=1 Tax=unclassified Phycicoccus TaxID=2637926 RepID=UPI0007024389|nr:MULTISPECIES: GNAT family N-acetyltransferase [unclassified Phycicoccus]KQU65503.1 GCN5 family acetyltransferase [Phycicoccus sp. Root101]KQZ89370.1 GCN5 family acetyltransferase [Phycicoccus sp. Root563]
MSEISVRRLGEDEWEQYKTARLSALEESPEAFAASLDEERGYDEDFWRTRLRRSQRLLAEVEGQTVGVVSVGQAQEGNDRVAELFGLWVTPAARGTGVATQLVQAGADEARAQGRSHLAYWVGSDNGRAVAFASGAGFRPTDSRRPMRVQQGEDEEDEVAMVLPLGEDRGTPSL